MLGRARLLIPLGLVVLALVAGLEREGSRDFHWHLVLGEQTLRAGAPVRTEQFSFTNAGAPVFVSAWLADVVLALVFRFAGYAGCQLLRALMIAVVLLCSWQHARRRGAAPLVGAALGVLTLAGILPRFHLRPEMFALASAAALLLLLAWHERTRRRAALVAALLLCVLWANLHGSVIVGLTAISLYALEQAYRRRADRRAMLEMLVLPPLAFLATCLNPEGARLPLAFRIVSPNFSTYIAEWRPLERGLVAAPIILLALAAVVTTLRAGRRVSPWRLGFSVILTVLSLRYHRFVAHLILALVPLVADNLGLTAGPAIATPPSPTRERTRTIELCLAVATMVFALVSLGVGRFGPGRLGVGTRAGAYPERACSFARQARLPGRMLNSYDVGDYLLYCFPEQKVFIDQRAWSAYPDELLGEYLDAGRSDASLRALVERHDISWVFLNDADPIADTMAFDADGWRLMYFDDQAFLYARVDGAARERLGEGFRFLNPLNLPLLMNAPASALPRVRAELTRQLARCADCWRTKLVQAATELAAGDSPAFEAVIATMPSKIQQRPEVEFVRARHALATRRYQLAAALYHHLRKVGHNPLGAGALEAEALARGGDRDRARAVLDEIARAPNGAPLAAQLRIQLLGDRPTVAPSLPMAPPAP